MLGFAGRSIAHPDNRHLEGRVSLIAADVTLAGKARAACGLADGSFVPTRINYSMPGGGTP